MKQYLLSLFKWVLLISLPAGLLVAALVSLSNILKPRWDLRGLDVLELVINLHFLRADEIKTPDVVFVGDSSSFTGVNAKILSQELAPLSVQSFATFRMHTPRGHWMMVDYLIRKNKAPKYLIYQVLPNPALADKKEIEHLEAFTSSVQQEIALSRRDARERLLDFFGAVFRDPMAGIYGARFGKPIQYASAIAEENGTVGDPYPFGIPAAECGKEDPKYELTDEYKLRLKEFASHLARVNVKLGLIISSIPCLMATEKFHQGREDLKQLLLETFRGSKAEFLETPPSYPNILFATETHLNEEGRKQFTKDLVPVLKSWLRTGP